MSEITQDFLLQEARIRQVLILYATVIDERKPAGLADVFTPEGVAEYRGLGSFHGRKAIIDVVESFLGSVGRTQHMVTNFRITLNGGEAGAKCYLQATHAGSGVHEGKTMTVWGEYTDQLKLCPEGWRITHRELVALHVAGDVGVAYKGKSYSAGAVV